MTVLSLIALMGAVLGMSMISLSDEDLTNDDEQDPEIEPLEDSEIDLLEGASDEDAELADIGATFLETDDGVTLELGDDETGSLAVIYYTDTEDNFDDPIEVDEARFYLVPEGVDWSEASWETRDDVPGLEENRNNYELEDFEAHFELELLGVIDLKGVSSETDDPESHIGEIEANAPVAEYYLEATTDGDNLVRFLPEDFVVTRNGVAETQVVENTVGSDEADWLSTDVDGVVLDGANGDDVLVSYATDVTFIGGEGNDTIEVYGSGDNAATINAGNGDDVVRTFDGPFDVTVDLGSGDDYADLNGGTVYGGDGADVIYGGGHTDASIVTLFGGADDDQLTVFGDTADDVAFGGEGNDTVSAYGRGIANGGAGDDLVQVGTGSQAFGGDGNDRISVNNGVSEDTGPATLTGGEGQDTIVASIGNFGGEDEGVFATVTDFDPDEDILILDTNDFGGNIEIQNVTLIQAEDGSFTDVQMEYLWPVGDTGSGIAVVRLEGVTELTLAQIEIRT